MTGREVTGRVVVAGAGPAGMHAALAAAAAGAEVLLLDSEPAAGGQYHRRPYGEPGPVPRHPRITFQGATTVWAVEPGLRACLRLHLRHGPPDHPAARMSALDAAALVIATGAYDRVVPFPGWELPGVVTAGGAQAMAKGHRVAVGRRVLVAGTGPFLLPVALSLLDVGAEVVGVLEAARPGRTVRAWAGRPGAWPAAAGKLPELARYAAALARRGVPYRTGTAVVAAHGDDALESVTTARVDSRWRPLPGSRRRIAVDALCVGHGFTPRLELALAAGCALDDGYVAVDARQATSVSGVYAAGEVTGIGGATLAAYEGTLAGLAAARHLGLTAPENPTVGRRVRRGRAFAAGLAAAYPIGDGWREWLTADTVICRCEEVPYAALTSAVDHGAESVRALKLSCRVGLGLCQGRVCGQNAADLADARRADAGAAPLPDRAALH
ncbi:MAG: FAD-dependent oxidoreductase, partial [Natronosporangium sp.]